MKISPDKYYAYVATEKDILLIIQFSKIIVFHKVLLEDNWNTRYTGFYIFMN